MPKPTDRVNQAANLARDVAPDINSVLITHYPDIESLDTLRPGETDLEAIVAMNRVVALEMLEAGVEVLVQRADGGRFGAGCRTAMTGPRAAGPGWIEAA